jgi:hypothetical protein
MSRSAPIRHSVIPITLIASESWQWCWWRTHFRRVAAPWDAVQPRPLQIDFIDAARERLRGGIGTGADNDE